MNLAGYEWLKNRLESEEGRSKIEKTRQLSKIADELKISTGQLALAWCLKNPRVSSVILGASKKAQLEENMKALDAVPLMSASVMERIEKIVQNRPEGHKDFK